MRTMKYTRSIGQKTGMSNSLKKVMPNAISRPFCEDSQNWNSGKRRLNGLYITIKSIQKNTNTDLSALLQRIQQWVFTQNPKIKAWACSLVRHVPIDTRDACVVWTTCTSNPQIHTVHILRSTSKHQVFPIFMLRQSHLILGIILRSCTSFSLRNVHSSLLI